MCAPESVAKDLERGMTQEQVVTRRKCRKPNVLARALALDNLYRAFGRMPGRIEALQAATS